MKTRRTSAAYVQSEECAAGLGPRRLCCLAVWRPDVPRFSHRQPVPDLSPTLHRPSSTSCSGFSNHEGAGKLGDQVVLPALYQMEASPPAMPLVPSSRGAAADSAEQLEGSLALRALTWGPTGPSLLSAGRSGTCRPWSAGPSPASGHAHAITRTVCKQECARTPTSKVSPQCPSCLWKPAAACSVSRLLFPLEIHAHLQSLPGGIYDNAY